MDPAVPAMAVVATAMAVGHARDGVRVVFIEDGKVERDRGADGCRDGRLRDDTELAGFRSASERGEGLCGLFVEHLLAYLPLELEAQVRDRVGVLQSGAEVLVQGATAGSLLNQLPKTP